MCGGDSGVEGIVEWIVEWVCGDGGGCVEGIVGWRVCGGDSGVEG